MSDETMEAYRAYVDKAEKRIKQMEAEVARLNRIIARALSEIPPNPKLALTIIIRTILNEATPEGAEQIYK